MLVIILQELVAGLAMDEKKSKQTAKLRILHIQQIDPRPCILKAAAIRAYRSRLILFRRMSVVRPYTIILACCRQATSLLVYSVLAEASSLLAWVTFCFARASCISFSFSWKRRRCIILLLLSKHPLLTLLRTNCTVGCWFPAASIFIRSL